MFQMMDISIMFEVVKYRKIMILFFNGNIKTHTEMNEKLNINTVTLNPQKGC